MRVQEFTSARDPFVSGTTPYNIEQILAQRSRRLGGCNGERRAEIDLRLALHKSFHRMQPVCAGRERLQQLRAFTSPNFAAS
jgi:hypothetical protein